MQATDKPMDTNTIHREQNEDGYTVEYWLSRDDAQSIEYADYWNDEGAEAEKAWNVADKGFDTLEAYLATTGYADDIRRCAHDLAKAAGAPLAGDGIDLAAGCLWAVPVVLESERVRHIHCLEFSAHRLLKLGPRVLKHYGVAPDRVTLAYGSFYDIKRPDGSFDFALLASALHHADEPVRLLREVHRVLKPGGVVMVTGEPRVTWLGEHLKYVAKLILPRLVPAAVLQKLFGRAPAAAAWPPTRAHVFPVHPELGDHLYTLGDYRDMFAASGFRYKELAGKNMRAFVLFRA